VQDEQSNINVFYENPLRLDQQFFTHLINFDAHLRGRWIRSPYRILMKSLCAKFAETL
jgi:hypothetical protein